MPRATIAAHSLPDVRELAVLELGPGLWRVTRLEQDDGVWFPTQARPDSVLVVGEVETQDRLTEFLAGFRTIYRPERPHEVVAHEAARFALRLCGAGEACG